MKKIFNEKYSVFTCSSRLVMIVFLTTLLASGFVEFVLANEAFDPGYVFVEDGTCYQVVGIYKNWDWQICTYCRPPSIPCPESGIALPWTYTQYRFAFYDQPNNRFAYSCRVLSIVLCTSCGNQQVELEKLCGRNNYLINEGTCEGFCFNDPRGFGPPNLCVP